jgi:hypothetical protein
LLSNKKKRFEFSWATKAKDFSEGTDLTGPKGKDTFLKAQGDHKNLKIK